MAELTPEMRSLLRSRAVAAPEGRPVFARSYVLALLDALEAAEADLALVSEAWWAGAEQGDGGHVLYSDPDTTLDAVWDAIKDRSSVLVVVDDEEAQDDAQQRAEQAEEAGRG